MSRLHICNTFFESELEETRIRPLAEWLSCHPAITQLQYLPILYAEPDDLILVSQKNHCSDPRLRLMQEIPPSFSGSICDWGPSRAIHTWAQKKELSYPCPDWEQIRTLNSKHFSFSHSPKLPHAALLRTSLEVEEWLHSFSGPKVLKTVFGTAGKGHFHPQRQKHLASFLQKQFSQNLPVIGEPWVERVLDFSTQWDQGNFLGATVFESESNGTYKGTLAGPSKQIFGSYDWALQEHKEVVGPLVKQMSFYGNFGIDAFVYRWQGKLRLQPIVEINGRKTMSWVALQLQQKTPDLTLRLQFEKRADGLLPSLFSRNLTFFLL